MLKSSIVCVMLLAFTSAVLGCKRLCSPHPEREGRCQYNCNGDICNESSKMLQMQFLNDLRGKGLYDCRTEGDTGVSCAKTPEIGECNTHMLIICKDNC